jgi:hypothetical protein
MERVFIMPTVSESTTETSTIHGFYAMHVAFNTARSKGIEHPKMKIDGLTFTPAPATGMNPNAIYVKYGKTYYGKIVAGVFQPISYTAVSTATIERIQKIMCDPVTEAEAYGRRTGICAICGRGLTKAESIDRGIGPICAEKMGW